MKKAAAIILIFLLTFVTAPKLIAQINFEFRGVWIATVTNIDWPKQRGLPTQEQKSSFINLLDTLRRTGINAVIMQIRPSADAFYPSQYEPWSEYLTGKQGLAPNPYYDPLQFMIEETHKRGMEFHAWINPYRAVFNLKTSSIDSNHITRQHPEWFIDYENKRYFNPGLPEVRRYVCTIVKDIVSRYDIDGLHMDDYFYPYPVDKKLFPDDSAYQLYGRGLEKNDWRRSNCDSIIENIYETICETNIRVKFGVSPFGVWRNKNKDPLGSNTNAGTTSYDDLFANVLLWLQKGWIDYVAPQIYWECNHKQCSYNTLLNWWSNNTNGKHLYIGHGLYKVNNNAAWSNTMELPNQIMALRSTENAFGSILFSSKEVEKNSLGWRDSLINDFYKLPAIVPPMPWIDSILPNIPIIKKMDSNNYVVNYKGEKKIKGFGVFTISNNKEAIIGNATLIKIITTDNNASINQNDYSIEPNCNFFIASISINNNVSRLICLN